MKIIEINGFYSNVVDTVETRQYTAKDYLKNQHIFLKRLADLLDCDSKAGALVDMQIANLEMAIEEVSK
ncbi:hypothetical protein [Leuconostoc mesenteroides]|uniref:hypothetical protein n=1 Tax=Leuconostoc mesenteroides TaxID=1245 RepID=UPI000A0383E3|nr:hypothetical protein [Leuconostoc mesenteroides]ORI42735.1 hypothetical protein BMR91_00020 [Leuconostoc mesenteroides subsp. cremoris]ORI44034.1 hypothetical protein BMR92_00020 [Leuconostoc mesenteroides subsp. cremoris]